MQEGETQRVEFPEEERSMVHRMLQHLYLQTYTVDLGLDPFWSLNDSWAKTRLHVHAQIYSLGDKYDIPSLKKEAARRFREDVGVPGHRKRETLTLLSVVDKIYTTTPDSDRGLRDLVVRQIFQRYNTASKHFVEELDNALEVRQFARDLVVLHRKGPTLSMRYAALAREVYRIWHSYVVPLLATTIFAVPTAASIRARLHGLRATAILGFLLQLLLMVLVALIIHDARREPGFKEACGFEAGPGAPFIQIKKCDGAWSAKRTDL